MSTPTEPTPEKFSVKSKQTAYDVNGIKSEIIITEYSDRLMVVVTQFQKLGTIVQIDTDTVLDEMHKSSLVYDTKVLLGIDEPLTHVIAKNLTSGVKTNKQILLTMALKDTSVESVKTLKSLVEDCYDS